MATPARRGDWSRTYRGMTVITHPQLIWSFAERSRATRASTTQECRVHACMQRARRRRLEFNP